MHRGCLAGLGKCIEMRKNIQKELSFNFSTELMSRVGCTELLGNLAGPRPWELNVSFCE